jgi:hypothetical protein
MQRLHRRIASAQPRDGMTATLALTTSYWVNLNIQVAAEYNAACDALRPPPQPAARLVPAGLVADELRKLAELRDAGVLTDEEFAVQKARLLG